MAQHRFKKGNQAAKGRTLPPDLLAIRAYTKAEVESLFQKYMHYPTGELIAMLKKPEEKMKDLPAIESLIVSILARGIADSDQKKLEFVLDRIYGKVTQPVEVLPPMLGLPGNEQTEDEELDELLSIHSKMLSERKMKDVTPRKGKK